MTTGKKIGFGVLAVVIALVAFAGGQLVRMLRPRAGEHTGSGQQSSVMDALKGGFDLIADPRAQFPGKDRLTVLCMGIDDNWTDKDEVYTRGARTDTLFLLTLDLNKKTATMLSIPRDTYAHIAGTDRTTKINAAYELGGPQCSVATVAEMFDVQPDYYLVLNIDATKRMVDALGGVDLNVEHEMHYHDKWGHLSIDLMPGFQHLTGDEAVGFARYRHPDAGVKPSPEDGDDRRMYRQHVLLKAMVVQARKFGNLAQGNHLVDVAMSSIATDMTRSQLAALAEMYHGIQPDQILTASLTGSDYIGPGGVWYYKLDMDKAKAYVDWLVRGDDSATRQLVPVIVRNSTPVSGLAAHVAAVLKAQGYTDVHVSARAPLHDSDLPVQLAAMNADGSGLPQTVIVDSGVPDPNAGQQLASLLGLTNAAILKRPAKPNKAGWTPPPTLTVTLGHDYAQAAVGSGVLSAAPSSGGSADTQTTQ